MSLILWGLLNHARASARFTEREHPMARILMAAGLASWAKDLPQPCKATLHTPRHRRTPDQRAEVADWRKRRRAFERLALQWLQDGIDDEWVNRLDAKLTSQWRPESQPISPPVPREPLTGPAKIVMATPFEISAAWGRERREEAQRWNRLAAPLPLVAGPPRDELERILLSEFPWMHPAIARIGAELALRERGHGGQWFHIRPLLLVGPPASGKSRFARRLGEIVGLHARIMGVGGSSDARELLGTARGWGTATPSGPVRLIVEARQANPLLVLDELDKVGTSDHNGRVTDALLTMIEAETAARWYDEGLGATVDLTSLNWIFLANYPSRIPGPLKSRLGIVQVDRPAPTHLAAIMDSMLDDIAKEIGTTADQLPSLHPQARAYLERAFVRGASMRQIRAAIEKALAVPIGGKAKH